MMLVETSNAGDLWCSAVYSDEVPWANEKPG